MNFIIYDIALLLIFLVFTSIFLFRHKANLKREGLLFLYKTSRGIKIINRIGNKNKKLLDVLSYVSIILGFLLMGTMIYLFGKIVWLYVFHNEIVSLIKVPPIMPLLPYLPQVFKMNYLPPFYFIYWIVILAIVAISHEFSHGIFAANKKVKIKSTGFGFFPFFLPIFLAAFVELDEKRMEKKKISHQMAILSAGTFANTLTAIFFFGILLLFFSLAFTPSGVIYDVYTYSAVGLSAITSINNLPVMNASYNQVLNSVNEKGLSEIKTGDKTYLATKTFLATQQNNSQYVLLYDNAPAVKANLSSTIIKINGIIVNSKEKLGEEIQKYSPGTKIIITTLEDDYYRDYAIVLGQNPENKTESYLGIGFMQKENSGILSKVMGLLYSVKDSNIYYSTKFNSAEFIYDLLWWLVMISLSVALVNMLPVGIFDGGRFFYLAVLAITKKEKIAKKAFGFLTYLFLLLVLVIMIFWAIGLFK
jgi:membrane-associated protease RseP (regulator of RpoE activity)